MTEAFLFCVLLLLSLATEIDLRTREIPDSISIAIVLLAGLAAIFDIAGIRWWMVISGGALGLMVGYGLFRFAKFGGGDSKLIAALGALLGPVGLLIVLFWMALAGGILALIAAGRGQKDFAYGPAITCGYCAYLIWPVGILQRCQNLFT